MEKAYLKKHKGFFCAVLAVTAAAVLRQIGFQVEAPLDWLCSFFRSVIYIVLFTAWGISVRGRIIQPQVRRCLTAVSALMAFWVTARTVRYTIAEDPWVLRHLWYMYYLPMLFIPVLAIFVALSLGKPENFRLPKWTCLLYLPTTLLFLLVLTNDLHQLVFAFPADAAVWMNDYRHGAGYFLAVGWQILCALTALSAMLLKCRVSRSRRVLMMPFVPVILAVAYGILDIFRLAWLKMIAGDMTVVFCLLITAALESCIQCGLIQSNTRYGDLFRASTLAAQITDEAYRVCFSSQTAAFVPSEVLCRTAGRPVMLGRGIRLSGAPIQGGHVIWQDDVSELQRMLEAQASINEQLEEENDLLMAENQVKEEKARVATKNRLYDHITREVEPQLLRMDALLHRDGGSPEERLREICILGAYIKRRSNMILLSENQPYISAAEAAYCFMESVNNLEAAGVECSLRTECVGDLHIETALAVYDFFEAVVEQALPELNALLIHLTAREGEAALQMMLDSGTSAEAVRTLPQYRQILERGGQCRLTGSEGELQMGVFLGKGGDAQ
ncbi:MAG: histidine kinase N-terminal 7TM domain-containing protein [Butyricicoccaceae bacterium]